MANSTLKSGALWIIKGGLFIVPFIPLYVSKVLFFPYITGKAFVFRLIVEIIFFAWLALAISYPEFRPKKTPVTLAISFFIVVVTLATIFGVSPFKSFWSNFERMEGLVSYLHLFAYFLVLTNVFKKSDWKIFFNLFIIAAIYENSYAFLQKIGILLSPQGGANRADGTIGNPTYLAAYLVFILGFCLLLWSDARRRWQKYWYGLMAAWTLVTIYFTGTRGAVLGLMIGVIVFGIGYLFLKKPENPSDLFRKKIILSLLLAAIIIPVGIFFLKDTSFVRSNPTLARLTSLSLKERTITSRFTIWSMGWEGFKEHPLLGWGPDNYNIVFSKYFKPELWRQEPWFDRSHNIVFDWLINAGILGVVGYFGMIGIAISVLWRNFLRQNLSVENTLLLSTLLIVYVFQNLFVFDQIATYIGLFAVFAYVNSFSADERKGAAALKDNGSGGQKSLKPNDSVSAAPVFLLIPLALLAYSVNIRPLLVNLNLLDALTIQGQNIPLAFEKLTKALSYNTLGKEEVKEQLIKFSLSAGASPELSVDFRDKILRRAIEEAQKGVVENPLDPRANLFLGTIYQKVGLSDQAIAVFNKAIELSPKKQQIYFELADIYLQNGDYSKATEVLEKSFNLDRGYNQAGLNLAATYILASRQNDADKILLELFGAVEVPNQILTSVYSRIKDYDRLIGVWRAFVKDSPNNLEYRKSLSGAYLLANDNQSAIQALEEAAQVIPEFRSEAESLIKQIKSQ